MPSGPIHNQDVSINVITIPFEIHGLRFWNKFPSNSLGTYDELGTSIPCYVTSACPLQHCGRPEPKDHRMSDGTKAVGGSLGVLFEMRQKSVILALDWPVSQPSPPERDRSGQGLFLFTQPKSLPLSFLFLDTESCFPMPVPSEEFRTNSGSASRVLLRRLNNHSAAPAWSALLDTATCFAPPSALRTGSCMNSL